MDPALRATLALKGVLELVCSAGKDLHQVDPEHLYWLLQLIIDELERAAPAEG